MEGNAKFDIGIEVTPFYSTIIAATYYIFGYNTRNVFILNIILNCFVIILLFRITLLITKQKIISFITSFVFIFYYLLWSMNFSLMMEVPTVLLLSLSTYYLGKYYYEQKIKFIYFATIIQAVLCLMNNRFIVLQFVFWALLFVYIIYKRMSWKSHFALPIVLFLFIISPWFIRQYVTYHNFVFFTPMWNNVIEQKFGLLKRIDVKTDVNNTTNRKQGPHSYSEYVDKINEKQKNRSGNTKPFTLEKYNSLTSEINEKKSKRDIGN
jgi:4-amino-4-deoxy-L-arabinose transferase-like glycosyltransferase